MNNNMDNNNNIFKPFDKYGILCEQNGKITSLPNENEDWIEWHLDEWYDDIYWLERCDSECTGSIIYCGRIPSREFFVQLMNNQQFPPPEGWENFQ